MSYAVSQAITIDHTKCGSANTSNFPLLVNSTIAGLKTVGNGGNVQSSSGYDIAFFSDALLTTLLPFEIESWSASTGAIIAWVKVPTLSFSADTVIYLAYDDASVVSSQQDVPNTWESSYHGVWHLGTGGGNYSASQRADSTSNGNTLFNASNVAASATGVVGDAFDTSSGTKALAATDNTTTRLTSAFTIEAWGKPDSFALYRTLLGKGTGTVRNYQLDLEQTTGKPRVVLTQGASNYKLITAGSGVTLNNWHYIVGTWDGTTLRLYVDASASGTLAVSGSADNSSATVNIGDLSAFDQFSGLLDECRISDTARSASYVTATYNNINDPSTFYTLGAGGSPPVPTSATQRFTLSML